MSLTLIQLTPEELGYVVETAVQRAFNKQSPTLDTSQKYIAIEQAVTKYKSSKSYFYQLSSKRKVSTRRVGKSIQFDVDELDAYFNSKAKRSQTAIDADLKNQGVFPTLKVKGHV